MKHDYEMYKMAYSRSLLNNWGDDLYLGYSDDAIKYWLIRSLNNRQFKLGVLLKKI